MKENILLETNNFSRQVKAIQLKIASPIGSQMLILRTDEIISIQLPSPRSKCEVNGKTLISQTVEDIFKVVPESEFLKYLDSSTKRLWWFRKSRITEIMTDGKTHHAIKVGEKVYGISEKKEFERLLEEIDWEIENPSNP